MLTLTYEYKLQPSRQQIEMIEHTLSVCRSVWNFALRERKDWQYSRKSPVNACSIQQEYIIPADEPYPNYHKQAKALTEAKKNHKRLKSVNAQVLQQVLRTLDRAFADMKAKGLGFPRFKNRYRLRSYVYPQLGKEVVKGNCVKLPQLGWVKFKKSREVPEGFKVKQARVVRKASGYFVMLSLQLEDCPTSGRGWTLNKLPVETRGCGRNRIPPFISPVDLAGALPSQESVRQESLVARLGISYYSCQA